MIFGFMVNAGEEVGAGEEAGRDRWPEPEEELRRAGGGDDDPSGSALHAAVAGGPPVDVGGRPDAGRGGAGRAMGGVAAGGSHPEARVRAAPGEVQLGRRLHVQPGRHRAVWREMKNHWKQSSSEEP